MQHSKDPILGEDLYRHEEHVLLLWRVRVEAGQEERPADSRPLEPIGEKELSASNIMHILIGGRDLYTSIWWSRINLYHCIPHQYKIPKVDSLASASSLSLLG